jgi:hypothetical protein
MEDERITEAIPEKAPKISGNVTKDMEKSSHKTHHKAFFYPTQEHHPVESDTVDDYAEGSAQMNMALHRIHKGLDANRYHIDDAHNMDSVFSAAHPSKADRVVFTGLRRSPTHMFDQARDDTGKVPEHITMHHPAFLSTSSSSTVAHRFSHGLDTTTSVHPSETFSTDHPGRNGSRFHEMQSSGGQVRHMLMLHVPKGTSAISVNGGDSNSNHIANRSVEHEVILDRGHKIKIHHSPTYSKPIKGEYGDHSGIMIWHGEVVGQDKMELPKTD